MSLPDEAGVLVSVLLPGESEVSPGELEPHDHGHHSTRVQVNPGGSNSEMNNKRITVSPVLERIYFSNLYKAKCPPSWVL